MALLKECLGHKLEVYESLDGQRLVPYQPRGRIEALIDPFSPTA